MKANQKFVTADEAVSPVIGVILMVAITVILAAVVFVVVGNLSGNEQANENAAVQATSPSAGVLQLSLITAGEHAPYVFDDETSASYATVTLNGVLCVPDNAAAVAAGTADIDDSTEFKVGVVLRFDGANTGPCHNSIVDGDSLNVIVTLAGTQILNKNVDIKQ